jgi:hypothetical protein
MAEAAPYMASLDGAQIGVAPDVGPAGDDGEDQSSPLRRCLVTGESRSKAELLRFTVGPDGQVVPDLEGKLPGRGLWVTAARAALDRAVKKNLFAKAARRAVLVDGALADQVERLLVRRCIELIGLARRAGNAVAGHEKVADFLRRHGAGVLLAAADGAAGGVAKLTALAQGARRVRALTGAELGQAFGADHRVHAAVGPGRLADKLVEAAGRLAALRDLAEEPLSVHAPLSEETARR